MSSEEENALATIGQKEYAVMLREPQAVLEVLSENMGGEGIDAFGLDRIAIPAGGALAWSVPTLEGEKSQESIVGVIIHWQDVRVYWAGEYTGENTPPDCDSEDGITGKGMPGGSCATCPNAAWESDPKGGKGQACKLCRRLFILTPGEILPTMISLPPTSLGAARKFFQRLASRAIPFFGVEVKLDLEKAQNAGGIKYGRVKLGVNTILRAEQVEQVRALREVFRPTLTTLRADPDDYVDAEVM